MEGADTASDPTAGDSTAGNPTPDDPYSRVDHEGRLLVAPLPWRAGDVVDGPLDLYRCRVLPAWVDYNRHMTEAAYLTAFGWASDAMFSYIGDDDAYRAAGHSFYTVETHIRYLREAAEHAPLRIGTYLLGVDRKRLHLAHTMIHGETGVALSTGEQMLVHVDTNAGRSAEILPAVRAALDAITQAHATLVAPALAGCMSLR